jgi:RNA polymerase sigma factor (sigma-70 family)
MDKIENYLKNPDVVNIMNAVSNKYRKSIDPDEIDSIKMTTLWKCIDKFDPLRGAKFTSYLYQQLSFAFKNELKKKKQIWYRDNNQIDAITNHSSQEACLDFGDTISGLPDDVVKILEQRFLGNMTMVEIASANGYSRETARRRLKKAIKICKKSNGQLV